VEALACGGCTSTAGCVTVYRFKGFLFWLGCLRSAAAAFALGSGMRRRQ